MIREFRLPDIGEGLTEAEVVSWMVDEGERVELDQPVVEIETDKALMQIPTPYAGRLMSHGVPEGTVLAVGEVLLTVETDEPDIAVVREAPADRGKHGAEAAPIVGTISSEAVDLTRRAESQDNRDAKRPEALPLVRRLARDLGVDLASVTGSGSDGRITREDVQKAAEAASDPELDHPEESEAAVSEIMASASSVDPDDDGEAPMTSDAPEPRVVTDEDDGAEPVVVDEGSRAEPEPIADSDTDAVEQFRTDGAEIEVLSKMRRTIASRMAQSWRDIPHVTTFGSADVTRLLTSRTALKTRRQAPVSIDAMVVKAVATALDQHRLFAAHLVDASSILHPSVIDIGVAVDTADGLTVVVVENPAALDLVALTAEIARLADGARNRSLDAGAFTGQSFTVSNIGAVGGGFGTPIIPSGTTAILSVGKAEDVPVARDGRLQIAPMMPLSLSYDHRLIDGAAGRRFLATIIENLEEPTLFLA